MTIQMAVESWTTHPAGPNSAALCRPTPCSTLQAPQLRREAESLERERLMLEEVQLPALHVALARLNDTHVLEVGRRPCYGA